MRIGYRFGGVHLAVVLVLTFAAIVPAVAATISVSAPGTLDQAGATYVLTQDVSAPGTAFYITARGITFDLNGHTITYNSQASTSAVYGISVGSQTVWLNMDDTGLRIKNGSITQGAGATAYSDGILAHYTNPVNMEVTAVNITVRGSSCRGMSIDWGRAFNLHHNTITSNITQIANRYAYDGFAMYLKSATDSAIHDNTIIGGHGGIALVSGQRDSVYGNDISHRAIDTNGYGILLWAPSGVQIYQNNVHTTDGVGILVDGAYQNVEVSANTVDVQMGPKPEYGYGYTAWALKCRTYPDQACLGGLNVHDNVFRATTGAGLVPAAGIGIYDSHPNLNNQYHDNQVTAVTTDATKEAAGIRVAGVKSSGSGTRVFRNTVTSNNVNLDMTSSDGAGPDGIVFESNTLVRGANPINYHTINVGYWNCATENTVFLDTIGANGASVQDVAFASSSDGGAYSYSVQWYLTVTALDSAGHPIAGASVTAAAQPGLPEVVGTTDDQGVAKLALTQYFRSGVTYPVTSNYAYHTPHTVRVAKPGYQDAVQVVTMDASKAGQVVLTPADGAPQGLGLSKAVDKPSALPGETVTYTITFWNPDATPLNALVVTDSVPAEVAYVPGSVRLNGVVVTPDPYSAGQIAVAIGTLDPGASGVITFQAVVR